MAGTVLECGALVGFFDNEYKNKSILIRTLAGIDRFCSNNLITREACNLLLEPLAKLNDLVTPLDDAGGTLVVFSK